jgi:hypothetical protein
MLGRELARGLVPAAAIGAVGRSHRADRVDVVL